MNATKHGERSAQALAGRRVRWALYRLVRDNPDALRAMAQQERGRVEVREGGKPDTSGG